MKRENQAGRSLFHAAQQDEEIQRPGPENIVLRERYFATVVDRRGGDELAASNCPCDKVPRVRHAWPC
jgi:hypothetical protein